MAVVLAESAATASTAPATSPGSAAAPSATTLAALTAETRRAAIPAGVRMQPSQAMVDGGRVEEELSVSNKAGAVYTFAGVCCRTTAIWYQSLHKQIEKFGMGSHTRAATSRAAAGGIKGGQTIAAQCGHDGRDHIPTRSNRERATRNIDIHPFRRAIVLKITITKGGVVP